MGEYALLLDGSLEALEEREKLRVNSGSGPVLAPGGSTVDRDFLVRELSGISNSLSQGPTRAPENWTVLGALWKFRKEPSRAEILFDYVRFWLVSVLSGGLFQSFPSAFMGFISALSFGGGSFSPTFSLVFPYFPPPHSPPS